MTTTTQRRRVRNLSHVIKPVTGPSHLQKLLAQFIGYDRACKMCHVASHWFGWASAIGVLFIIVSAAVMFTRPQPGFNMPMHDYEMPRYEYAEGKSITLPLRIEASVQIAKYVFTLKDRTGNVIYEWPMQLDPTGKPFLTGISLALPNNLTLDNGNYYVHASIDYRYNPVSRQHTEGNVARITVKGQQ